MLRLTSWLLTVMLVAVGADDISQALEQETCQGQVSSVKKPMKDLEGGPNPGAPKAVRHVGNGNCTVYDPF